MRCRYDVACRVGMNCLSPFASLFDKFKGKKSINEFITQKEESIQYFPLFPTLQAILQHEGALSHLLAENSIPGSGSDKSILSF